jgi:hypothetical protein
MLSVMRKPLPKLWQSVGGIIIGVIFYLFDCLIAQMFHPKVSWIESGAYMGGPLFLVSVMCVLIGIFLLLKSLFEK